MHGFWWACAAILAGLTVLVVGGELLVRGASRLAAAVRISPLVIGLTVVAFGTSAPELAVSVQAALSDSADLAVGNVVGSNIFNVLFILGISALIVPLVVSSQLIRRDVPLMIGVSFLLLLFGADGSLNRFECGWLFAGLVVYTGWCLRQSRKESSDVRAEFAQQWDDGTPGVRAIVIYAGLILIGLVLLGLGSRWLIAGAVAIAARLGLSQLIIGLTVIAAGTSLPEAVTSVVAAARGQRDIAVGNVVGSNIFNILCVLGITGLVAPDGIAVNHSAIWFDIPIMIAVAVACLPIFFTGNVIARWEGGLFFFYYLAYMSYLVLGANDNDLQRTLATVIIVFVVPLTAITLAVTTLRSLRKRRGQ